MAPRHVIRVLVVDDSALVRAVLKRGLDADPGIEVVGTARDPYEARDLIVKLKPHVLTLDVEMPRMDGVEFLRKLMPQFPIPVVMVSSLTRRGTEITMAALEAGAVDFVAKPTSNMTQGLEAMLLTLRTKVKIASTANVSGWKARGVAQMARRAAPTRALSESTDKVIAIGASTGGTEAIRKVITQFPRTGPGVVIVQHMPPGFTKAFADRMNSLCQMHVKEAEDGDRVLPGQVLIAPGGFHMEVIRSGGLYKVKLNDGPKVSSHRPSVDVLFNSVAQHVGRNAVAAILTGMGGDGSDGMFKIRTAGGRTVVQDEASCVVFGMPQVAWKKGGAEKVVDIHEIAPTLMDYLTLARV